MFLFEHSIKIGQGHNAIVYDNGDDTITKKYVSGKIKSWDRLFYDYCMSNPFKYFPKVYDIGDGYVVMEKLKCHTPKCDKWIAILDEDFYGISVWERACNNIIPKTTERTEEGKLKREVLNWCIECKNKIESINYPMITWRGCDLQENNIGERDDGTIVFFDI